MNRNKCLIGQIPKRGITNNQTTKGIDTDLKPTSADRYQIDKTRQNEKNNASKQRRHMIALKICFSLITLYFLSVTPMYLSAFSVIEKTPHSLYFIFFNHIGTGPINIWLYADFRADCKGLVKKIFRKWKNVA